MCAGKLEKSLDGLIIALCLDYRRRSLAVRKKTVLRRTDTEFRYLNFKIYSAAEEIVGKKYAQIYIDEIGQRIGYAKSRLNMICEGTYKKYKRKIKDNIAKKLHLCD